MKHNYFNIAVITLLFCFLITVLSGQNTVNNTILVLGPQSKLINDIQERILRETVMRSLQAKDLQVVPVMKIEQIIQEQGLKAIRKTERPYLKRYCNRFRAGYVLTGTIIGYNKKNRSDISPNKHYICSVKLYDKKNDIFHNISFELTGKENIHGSFSYLADLIAKSVKDKIGN